MPEAAGLTNVALGHPVLFAQVQAGPAAPHRVDDRLGRDRLDSATPPYYGGRLPFPPAAESGQGALAVQARENDLEIIELASKIDHKPTRIATGAERLVLAAMKGGCSIPLGVYAKIMENRIEIHAMIADLDGKNLIKRTKSSPFEKYKTCAAELAEELLQSGGHEILNRIK